MSGCLSMEAIARPGGLSPAERAHAADCARCAVRVAQYRGFVEGRVEVSQADFADAQARMGEFLSRRLGVAAPPAAVAPRVAAGVSAWTRFVARFSTPAGRLALGFAAIAAVAGGVLVLRAPQGPPSVVRGTVETALVVAASADTTARNVTLRWGAQPGADGYTIEIVSVELVPLGSFGPVREPAFRLARGAVRALPPGTTVYCRVVAKRAVIRSGP